MKRTTQLVVTIALALGIFNVTVPNAEAAPSLKVAAMASANTQKGARYVYGAAGGYSRGYDCSGLIYWAYRQHGKTLYRTAQQQYDHSRHLYERSLQPGDLVFIRTRSGVFHAGIYIGVKYGKRYMLNANSGSYRGRKVVEAPISEYTYGAPYAVYGRY